MIIGLIAAIASNIVLFVCCLRLNNCCDYWQKKYESMQEQYRRVAQERDAAYKQMTQDNAENLKKSKEIQKHLEYAADQLDSILITKEKR